MSLNDAAKAAAVKKVTLLDESFARFAVRATLAGVYLCTCVSVPPLPVW